MAYPERKAELQQLIKQYPVTAKGAAKRYGVSVQIARAWLTEMVATGKAKQHTLIDGTAGQRPTIYKGK